MEIDLELNPFVDEFNQDVINLGKVYKLKSILYKNDFSEQNLAKIISMGQEIDICLDPLFFIQNIQSFARESSHGSCSIFKTLIDSDLYNSLNEKLGGHNKTQITIGKNNIAVPCKMPEKNMVIGLASSKFKILDPKQLVYIYREPNA